MPLPRARELLIVAAALTIVAIVTTVPLALHIGTAVPRGGVADPVLNAWILKWGADRIPHGLSGFFSPPIFYPYPNTLAYSETLLGISAIVAPVQWIGGNAALTYNGALLFSYVLAGCGMYLLVRELTGNRLAGFVSACAFAFCPYRASQLEHLQVLSIGALPLALWALHRYFARPTVSTLSFFVVAFVWQVLSNGYSLFFGGIAIATLVAWAVVDVEPRPWKALAGLGGGALVAAIVLMPMAVTVGGVWRGRTGPLEAIVQFSADFSTYFKSGGLLRHVAWLPGIDQQEGELFPGIATVLLAGCALAPFGRRQSFRAASPYLAMGVIAVLISFGPEPRAWGHRITDLGVFNILNRFVPLFSVIRAPARFGIVAILSSTVLAGFGTARLLSAASGRGRVLIVGVAVAAIALEGAAAPVATTPIPHPPANELPMYRWLKEEAPPGALLELPVGALGWTNADVEAQYAALDHRHSVINGFSRLVTPLLSFIGGRGSPFGDPHYLSDALRMLQALHVRYVIVRPSLYVNPDLAATTLQAFAASGQVVERYSFEGTWLFVLRDATEAHLVEPAGLLGVSEFRSRTTGPNHREIAIDFARPRRVSRIELVPPGARDGAFPMALEIVASDGSGHERMLFQGSVLEPLGAAIYANPERPRMVVPLADGWAASRILVRQHGIEPPAAWSADQLQVFERQP
jgi:hypothetical protein